MKKIFMLIFAMAVFASTAIFAYSADDTAEKPTFSVYNALGEEVLTGNTESEFKTAIANAESGYRFVLNKDLEITSSIGTKSTEEAPRSLYIDLAGNKIFSKKKTTVLSIGGYTEMNVYSSKPDGTLYVTNLEDIKKGGNIFCVYGSSSVINAGEVTLDGVTYPGENLHTYSSCLIDIVESLDACDENSALNINGGYYNSICSDYSGYIIPRAGKVTINIKNANIVIFEERSPINSAGANTTLNIENTVFLQNAGTPVILFNNLLGTVNFKNVISTYTIGAKGTATDGALTLEGRNLFSSSAELNTAILSGKNMIYAKANTAYTLANGETTAYYMDKAGSFTRIEYTIPALNSVSAVVSEADADVCVFKKGNESIEEIWAPGEELVYPYELPTDDVKGVYKNVWAENIDNQGKRVFTMEKTVDFNIYIGMMYDDDVLTVYLYIPGTLIDDSMISYNNSMVNEEKLNFSTVKDAGVNGMAYYRIILGTITKDTADKEFNITIPYKYNSVSVVGNWTVSLGAYIDRVLETEEEKTYADTAYESVKTVKEDFGFLREETEEDLNGEA